MIDPKLRDNYDNYMQAFRNLSKEEKLKEAFTLTTKVRELFEDTFLGDDNVSL